MTDQPNPMDQPKDVDASNDANIGKDFPGYPHYPAKEDIMDKRTDSHQVDVNVEELPNSNNLSGVSNRYATGELEAKQAPAGNTNEDDDLGIRPGTNADVDEDDLAILNSTNDEIGTPQNVDNDDLNSDLDVPGSELDDDMEARGEEDEENNYYSLGGDRNEANEEDPQSGPVRGEG